MLLGLRRSLAFIAIVGMFLSADAAADEFVVARQAFDQEPVTERITEQVWLIAGGYTDIVPLEQFGRHTYDAIRKFQFDNGFQLSGYLKASEKRRLEGIGEAQLRAWKFEKVSYPDSSAWTWVPKGLGLELIPTDRGLTFNDPRGRIKIHLISLPGMSVDRLHEAMLKDRPSRCSNNPSCRPWQIFYDHYYKDDWFEISAKSPQGEDQYIRYHRDGSKVTGFAIRWHDDVENIHADRISVIMAGSLWSAMTGAPFIEPPYTSSQQEQQSSTAPTTPQAAPVDQQRGEDLNDPPAPQPPSTAPPLQSCSGVTDTVRKLLYQQFAGRNVYEDEDYSSLTTDNDATLEGYDPNIEKVTCAISYSFPPRTLIGRLAEDGQLRRAAVLGRLSRQNNGSISGRIKYTVKPTANGNSWVELLP